MTTNDSDDIPGFYRDPKTGRYYKRTNDIHNAAAIKEMEYQKEKENILAANKEPRKFKINGAVSLNTNILKLLAYQETGFTANCNYNEELIKLKTKQLLSTKEVSISKSGFYATGCTYVRGGKHNLISILNNEKGEKSLWDINFHCRKMCSSSCDFDMQPPTASFEMVSSLENSLRVTDICDVSINNRSYFIYVGNDLNQSKGVVKKIAKSFDRSFVNKEFLLKGALWSCTSSKNSDRFAIGSENVCYILTNGIEPLSFRKVQGRVYSVEFNKYGTLLFCGLHSGYLSVFDSRANGKPIKSKKFGNGAVLDTHWIENKQSIIVSGVGGNLVMMDLRMNRQLVSYEGHVTDASKSPFSVNEDLNLLCATGRDKITRLWSMNNGHLLHSIASPNSRDKTHSWLFSQGAKWFVSLLQGRSLFTYEPVS